MMDIKKQNLLACTKRFHSLLSPLSLLQVLRLFCHRVSSLHLPHSLLCWMVRHLYCSLLPLCDSIPIYDISVDGNQVDKCIFCSDLNFLEALLCWMVRLLYCSLLPLCYSIPIYDKSVDGNQVYKCI